MKKFLLGIFFLISFGARTENVDSLWTLYQKYDAQKDTSILNVIYKITSDIKYLNPDTTIFLLNKGLAFLKKHDIPKYTSSYYELMGDTYWQLSEFQKSITAYHRSLEEYLKQGEKVNAGYMHSNIAYVFMDMGKYEDSFNSLQEALKIAEQEKNEALEILTLNYLANLYSYMNQFYKSIETYRKSLNYYTRKKNPKNIQMCLNNIGAMLMQLNNLDSAQIYFHQSLDIGKKIGDTKNISNGLLNLGCISYLKKEYPKAEKIFKEALIYNLERGDDSQLFKNYINLSNVYFNLNKLKASYQYAMKAKEIANRTENIKSLSSVHSSLASYYKIKKDYKNALENYEIHVQLQDSILGLEQTKQINGLAAKYENERKELEIKNLEKDKQLKEVLLSENEIKLQKEGMYRVGLIIGIGFVLTIAIFIFIGYKNKSKSHEIISKQKQIVEAAHHELEEKNQEIMDSITYAKRIQNAILPPLKVVKEYLTESFILYKPKDIVAGDFYWMESVSLRHSGLDPESSKNKNSTTQNEIAGQASNDDIVLFAAADCTGHGVPGAMVSVVCNNGLNRSVREYGLTDPGEILNKTREIVIAEFEKSEDEVKDGMDIALCSLRFNVKGSMLKENKETLNSEHEIAALLEYAGAHNPLWIIRPNHLSKEKTPHQVLEYELTEIKANKQPIGQFDNPEPYTTHTFELEKGDSIYIFSDGYVDQFGGEKGKKFKAKAFRELLLSIQDQSMEEQKTIIDKAFEKWRGDLEQIDDVCIIGVRI
tara:strand:- start:227 stop:2521 length:2295 start_codon:yes stop_codon:yes gene_type:complete